jgi:hypothetical protein
MLLANFVLVKLVDGRLHRTAPRGDLPIRAAL